MHARLAASGLVVNNLGCVEYDGAWQPIMVARRSVAGAQRRLLEVARSITRALTAQGVMVRAGAPDGVCNRRGNDKSGYSRRNLGL